MMGAMDLQFSSSTAAATAPIPDAAASRWPRPTTDWRTRRISVRDAVSSVGGVLCTCFVLPMAWGAARALRVPVSPGAVLLFAAVVLVAAHFILRATRPRDVDRGAAAIRTPVVPGVAGAVMDGERRGPLDRTWTGMHTAAGVAGIVGLTILTLSTWVAGWTPAIGGGLVVFALSVAVRHAWQGGVEVRWVVETIATGRRAVLYIATPARGTRLLDARYLLRCVEPVPGHTRAEVWSAERSSRDLGPPGPDEFVNVTFDLPASAPASLLGTMPPVYWELLVHGRSLWGDVTESFLLPVRHLPDEEYR